MSEDSLPSLSKKFIEVRGVPTCLIKAGDFHGDRKDTKPKTLFLVITGNPGVCDFYDEFLVTLHKESDYTIPAWVVSQAGHMIAPPDMVHKSGQIFGIEDQINHKIAFIEDFIQKNIQLVLIGHSIGCYMILEILKRKPSFQILKAILLFPTIERLRETPNAVILAPLAYYFRWVGVAACHVVYYIPDVIKRFFIRLRFGRKASETTIRAICNLCHPHCFDNFSHMGNREMIEVTSLDKETIQKNLDKIIFYYGQTDGWCPVRFFEDMKKSFPDGNVFLDKQGMAHAFCLLSSVQMAEVIWEWMKGDIDQ